MHRIARNFGWIVLGLLAAVLPARGQYWQSILVVDPTNTGLPGVTTSTLVDPNLKDPWGFSFTQGSPFWVSDQASSFAQNGTTSAVSTLYGVSQAGTPSSVPLIVNVQNLNNAPPNPSTAPGGNGPTGQVTPGQIGITTLPTDFNVTLANGTKAGEASFIFANLDGSIDAWKGGASGTLATVQTHVNGASFTGLAIGNATNAFGGTGTGAFLYAADQTSSSLDVFNSQWNVVGHLTDPNLPAGFTAFNVQNIGGILYVTFAASNGGVGGIVDEFKTDGTFIKTLVSDPNGFWLDQSWGVAQAPAGFGALGGDLLVGNNDASGWINAFDPTTGAFLGLLTVGGMPFSMSGLWGLEFGNGSGGNGPPNTLFFTAGPDNTGGIFGSITPVPEPTSLALAGLGGVMAFSLRRRLVRRG